MKIVTGTYCKILAQQISTKLGVNLANISISKFPSGEIKLEINENLEATNVYLLQSTSTPVNDSLIELFLLVNAIKQARPKRIILVLPYLNYTRQDLEAKKAPINCITRILHMLGVDKVITADIHSNKAANLFTIPLINIDTAQIFAESIRAHYSNDICIISPDSGGTGRAYKVSQLLNTGCAVIHKLRDSSGTPSALSINGDVLDKTCYIVDDIIDTAGTVLAATKLLMQKGAKAVHACITHGAFSNQALKLIEDSALCSLTITDTIESTLEIKSGKIITLSIADTIADKIKLLEAKTYEQQLT